MAERDAKGHAEGQDKLLEELAGYEGLDVAVTAREARLRFPDGHVFRLRAEVDESGRPCLLVQVVEVPPPVDVHVEANAGPDEDELAQWVSEYLMRRGIAAHPADVQQVLEAEAEFYSRLMDTGTVPPTV